MKDHMPSDLVPLHDGMILSFVNYELKVRIESKSNSAQKEQLAAQQEFFNKRDQDLDMQKSMGGAVFVGAATAAAAATVNVDDVQPESKPLETVEPTQAAPVEAEIAPVEAETAPADVPAEVAPVEEPPKDEVKETEPAVDNAAMQEFLEKPPED